MTLTPADPWLPAAAEPSPYLLGLDGGGTKTTALLTDLSGNVLGRGHAGSSNLKSVGEAAALETLRAAALAAYADAGVPPQLPRAAGLGVAGLDRPEEVAHLQPWAAGALPGVPLALVNDVELVLAAGSLTGWGIGVIAGTGAIAFGAAPDGRTVRVGGWGWAIGDEGSGFALGQAALQALARAADGRGPRTTLTEAVLNYWSLDEPAAVLGMVYQSPFPRAQIAALAPLVETAAAAGDSVAQAITRAAGRELARAAQAVAEALGLTGPIPAALAGGVLVKGGQVRAAFNAAIDEAGVVLEPRQLVTEPARGAIALARRLVM